MKKEMFLEFLERTKRLGDELGSYGVFNFHHINGKTNIVGLSSENELLVKYEHFDYKKKINVMAILQGSIRENGEEYSLSAFIPFPGNGSREYNIKLESSDFFSRAERLYSLIEEDDTCLTHMVTYDLYKIYKKMRESMDQQAREPYDWYSEEMLDMFNQELWELSVDDSDPLDIPLDTFQELSRIYKSSPPKPKLWAATNEKHIK